MKKTRFIRIFSLLIGAGVLFTGCAPEIDGPDVAVSKGSADFTKYVAVGNSLTAGFTNGGLYNEGQAVSFPNLIAQQLKGAGGGDFVQPAFPDAQKNGSGYRRLKGFDPSTGSPVLETVTTERAVVGMGKDGKTPLLAKYSGAITSLNNLGIPGIRVSNINTQGYGFNNPQGFNPYFERLLPEALAGASYLQVVTTAQPTFFTCWLGNNDVLDNAASGGNAPFTPVSAFQGLYPSMIATLTANGAKGVVATIPNILQTAFFNTYTVAAVKAQGQKAIPNAEVYIRTKSGVRAATNEDYIVLLADSIGYLDPAKGPRGFFPSNPLPDADVLDKDEAKLVNDTRLAYNDIIRAAATAKDLAVVDAEAFVDRLTRGENFQGVNVNTGYISGGLFSLDGIHLTPRGNALAANEFIKAINQKYGSTIPLVDVTKYPGIGLP